MRMPFRSEPAPGSVIADGTDQFAARHARQPALLLLLGAVVEHVVRADAVHALAEARDAAPAEFFVQHRFVAEVPAAAAVLGRDVHAEKTGRADLAPCVLVDVVLLAPLGVERHHLRFDDNGRSASRSMRRSSSIQGDS